MSSYTKGLHEVADGIHAYLQPDGGWGWSNAGLVVGDGGSLLVDTLFDLALTQQMLDAMASVVATVPIETLVNTHANGDHCYGNQLITGAEIIASAASAAEMENLPPSGLAKLLEIDLGPQVTQYLQDSFGAFRFDNIDLRAPDRTFTGELTVEAGGRSVELVEVGPAHTAGDVLVYVPDAKTIFTGDILFIEGTPIVWDGPVSNWLAACDRILALDCDVIVPGHGPLTDAAGVQAVKDYLEFVVREATSRYEIGMSAADAARDIALGPYDDWLDSERIAINVDTVYREIAQRSGKDPEQTNVIELFRRMAQLKLG